MKLRPEENIAIENGILEREEYVAKRSRIHRLGLLMALNAIVDCRVGGLDLEPALQQLEAFTFNSGIGPEVMSITVDSVVDQLMAYVEGA